jgi:mRNA interferase MazF
MRLGVAELDPTKGNEQARRRPVLDLSQDVYERSGIVIAVAITSQEARARLPLTIELTSLKMTKRSWVKINRVRTLLVFR